MVWVCHHSSLREAWHSFAANLSAVYWKDLERSGKIWVQAIQRPLMVGGRTAEVSASLGLSVTEGRTEMRLTCIAVSCASRAGFCSDFEVATQQD